ncbi:uncharacterized protein LOC132703882 [Cylas formicarius]|uniref:uncharacterized protein LOC132703882 n=1 Tax=Cylas formicarius TaxID=197179 RepID=UPI002958CD64|nr:uncharacterized protein LOC132703882 [Cylas formicarius]
MLKYCAIVFLFVPLCSAAPKIDSSARDNLQVTDDLSVIPHSGRSSAEEPTFETYLEDYIKSKEVSFDIPLIGSTVTLAGRNLDNEELDFKLKFDADSEVQARKKSKIKKIFIPILVFILIKAMTLIPLALGILAIKAWNAIQLSFISFVTTLAMAVWKLCSKVSGDHPPPPQIIHEHWDPHHYAAARSDDIEGMQMAYSGYAPNKQ